MAVSFYLKYEISPDGDLRVRQIATGLPEAHHVIRAPQKSSQRSIIVYGGCLSLTVDRKSQSAENDVFHKGKF